MEQFEFYKDFYFKELSNRNDINNSLSQPISLITALVAGIFYLFITFDYHFSWLVTVLFLVILNTGVFFLILSVYHLIMAYNDFPKGYEYSILADTNDLDLYYRELKKFYSDNPTLPDTSNQELENYLLNEMVKNTGDNQKNNKRKNKFRYNCEKYLITSFIVLCVSLPVFCVNYSLKSNKTASLNVIIDSTKALRINIDSKENRNFVISSFKDTIMSKPVNIRQEPPKPLPPRSQIIKEGSDPKPKP